MARRSQSRMRASKHQPESFHGGRASRKAQPEHPWRCWVSLTEASGSASISRDLWYQGGHQVFRRSWVLLGPVRWQISPVTAWSVAGCRERGCDGLRSFGSRIALIYVHRIGFIRLYGGVWVS